MRPFPGRCLAGSVILLVLGLLFHVSIVWTIGIIVLIIGAVLFVVGSAGRPIGPRRCYWWQSTVDSAPGGPCRLEFTTNR